MAISGLWKAGQADTGALKWGTGINPVHSIRTEGDPLRSSPVITGMGPGGEFDAPPETLTNDETGIEEISSHYLWGYGTDTGTSTRPRWGISSDVSRSTTGNHPGIDSTEGGYATSVNAAFREKQIGDNRDEAKLGFKEETVSEGWKNKTVGIVEDSNTSDPRQYEMQTSMTQRDKVRKGSQAQTSRASEYMAPIGSRRPTWGQRLKLWSGGQRHYDMQPKAQDLILRPFLYRNPGTGNLEWMQANEAFNYQLDPLQRQPVPDPNAGVMVPQSGNVYEQESSDNSQWVDVWY
ncbi:MAG: hypothetical protein ACREBW_10275 [Candidatus Micrarchaeaceae archaeon]